MKRIFHHYKNWEDWHDGLYRLSISSADMAEEIIISRAARLLSEPDALLLAMTRVIDEWKIAAEVNLSNPSRNRRAWLGQAACCFLCGAPEDLTKLAWHRLSDAERDLANAIADRVISEWEDRYGCQSAHWA